MRPRLNLILLGVADLEKSTAFYEALGWPKASTSHSAFIKFNLGGVVLALQARSDFAQDCNSNAVESNGFAGFALAYIARSAEEVPKVLASAARLGAQIVKPATSNNWGVAGYFRDLDGHLIEVCYEDGWVFDEQDNLVV